MRIKLFEEYSKIEIWQIFAGLGGGFGGANYIKNFTGSKEDAERALRIMSLEPTGFIYFGIDE